MKPFMPHSLAQRGFTLPETLIAIFILATVMGGLLVLMSQQARTLTILEQRAFASIVAENVMVETMMQTAPPDVATSRGEQRLANADWVWEREVAKTGQFGLLQIKVSVSRKNSPQQLAQLVTRRTGAPQ